MQAIPMGAAGVVIQEHARRGRVLAVAQSRHVVGGEVVEVGRGVALSERCVTCGAVGEVGEHQPDARAWPAHVVVGVAADGGLVSL